MGICKLCLKNKKLCDSHIYPEFLYNPLYDEQHSYVTLSTSSNKYPKRPRKGIYDKLFCRDCEVQLSRYESYASTAIFFQDGSDVRIEKKGRVIEVSDLDYHRFKLFMMSILWRSSIHTRDEFPQLKLGPHQEIMRSMILNEDPGLYYQYGTFMTTIRFNRDFLSEFILPLELSGKKVDGIRVYRGVFSGMFWGFIVSNHNHQFPLKDILLNEKGVLKIIIDRVGSRKFISELINGFMSNDKNFIFATT